MRPLRIVELLSLLLLPLVLAACGGGEDAGPGLPTSELGDSCGVDTTCLSGHCIDVDGGVCSRACDAGACPSGFECVDIGEGRGSWCVAATACEPVCDGLQCGPDPVCGQSCGTCADGATCTGGVCVCAAKTSLGCVDGEVWWFDSCGAAESRVAPCPQACVGGECVDCVPECGARMCGPEPVCGASCGTCGFDERCENGTCVGGPCVAQCGGKECGDDGCGGSCGTCSGGTVCEQGACIAAPDDCRTTGCVGLTWCDTATGECRDGCGIDAQCGDHERCDPISHACICDAETELCDGACVNTATNPSYCGRCERACLDGEVCQESDCQAVGDCRDDGCPQDYYCDLATGDCRGGCAFDEQCGANEDCDTGAHDCVCSVGFHRCGGACVANDSVDHCGTSCTPCPADAHGDVSCEDGACAVACDPNFEFCVGRCTACPTAGVAETECAGAGCVATSCVAGHELCLDGCAICPTEGVLTTTCAGAACVPASCATGYRACGGVCAACPTGAVRETTCAGTSCVIADCEAGYAPCGGVCASCPTENVAETACDAGGACVALACDAGYFPCASGCCEWTVEAVFPDDDEPHGGFPSIATDDSDRPNVSFAHYGRGEMLFTRKVGGAWTTPWLVDNTGTRSDSTSDMVIINRIVYVAYHQGEGVAYAYNVYTANGFNPAVTIVDSPTGTSSTFVSIAGVADGPFVVCWEEYHPNVADALHCRERTSDGWLEDEWVASTDGSDYDWGRKPVAVHGDTVHIAFGGLNADARYMTRESWAPPGEPQWVEDTALPAIRNVDLALDSAGNPHLCGAFSNDQLRSVWKDAGGWHSETVAIGLADAPACSVAIGGDDAVHVAWTDGSGAVGHAVRGATSWAVSFPTATGGNGRQMALAVDSQSRPHLAWYDFTAGKLMYATGPSRVQAP